MNNNGSSSVVVARHDYLPFGEEIVSGIGSRSLAQGYNASDTNRWKYGLTERDATSGLDHTWWRKYESLSGRWTSPDPLGGSIGDPQSFNRYSYTQNDPVNFVDPTGLFCVITGYRYEDYEYPNSNGDWVIGQRIFAKVECFLENPPLWRPSPNEGPGPEIGGIPIIPRPTPHPTPRPTPTPTPKPPPAPQKPQSRKDCIRAAVGKYLTKEGMTGFKRAGANAVMGAFAVTSFYLWSAVGAAGTAAEAGEITLAAAGIEVLHGTAHAFLHTGVLFAAGAYWHYTFQESYENNAEFRKAVDSCPKS